MWGRVMVMSSQPLVVLEAGESRRSPCSLVPCWTIKRMSNASKSSFSGGTTYTRGHHSCHMDAVLTHSCQRIASSARCNCCDVWQDGRVKKGPGFCLSRQDSRLLQLAAKDRMLSLWDQHMDTLWIQTNRIIFIC